MFFVRALAETQIKPKRNKRKIWPVKGSIIAFGGITYLMYIIAMG
ncbi:hypothetical protein SATMO3_29310 [Sporomusa aerivorans]